ncbi:Transmembrane amino acid transporter protein, partial [Trichostrongylus colubriformis]
EKTFFRVESKTKESPHDSAGTKSHSPQADQNEMEELENGDEAQSGRRSSLDYGDMAKEAFATRKTSLRVLGLPAKLSVNICIVLLQVGICSVFYIFVTEHIKEVFDFLFGTNLEIKIIYFVVLPFFMLLTTFQSLTFMSRVSFAGNVLMAIALVIVYVQLARSPHIPLSQLAGVTTISDAAVTSGSIMYALVAASVVLPLENKMRNPQQMLGFCGVISTSSMVVIVLYTSMGLMGYITYGSQIEGSITLNLTNNPVDFSVKVMLLLMTYCGYLIQYYPVTQMVWPIMEPYLSNSPTFLLTVANYTMRYTIVILSFLFAYTIPNLEKMIPIIGVSSGMLLVLVFPAVIESVIFWEHWKKQGVIIMYFHVILNAVYIVMGIFFLIVGVYDSVKSLNNHKHP